MEKKEKSSFQIAKLVNFAISSGSHSGKINVKNAWIVENLNLPPNKIDNAEIKNK